MTGREAAARKVLATILQPGTGGFIAAQTGERMNYHKVRLDQAIAAMLAHADAALAAERARYVAGLPREERVTVATVYAFEAGIEEGAREMRERAAKVAEEFATCGCGRSDCMVDGLAHAIAAAIRALDPAAREDGEKPDA